MVEVPRRQNPFIICFGIWRKSKAGNAEKVLSVGCHSAGEKVADRTPKGVNLNESEGSGSTFSSLLTSQWSDMAEGAVEMEVDEMAEGKTLNLKHLYLGPRLASGASSRLYKGVYRGQHVAVKIMRPPAGKEDRQKLISEFQQEVSLLIPLEHPNIVTFVGSFKQGNHFCVVTELLSGGTLRDFLRSSAEQIPLTSIVDMALDIASAMAHIHSNGIIHRDLKSANCVFDKERTALKVIDFGIARRVDGRSETTGEKGTFKWMAPEVMRSEKYSEKADVYSFGIVLWEIISRDAPFKDMEPIQAAMAVMIRNERPKIPDWTPIELRCLVEKCWQLRDEARPSFVEVVETLKGMKWKFEEQSL